MLVSQPAEVDMETEMQTSATWQIDWEHKRVSGRISDWEALGQSMVLRLQTELGQYLIYSDLYGLDWRDVAPGQEQMLMQRISQCLEEEERVTGICDFSIETAGDSCTVCFTVCTIWGDAQITWET